MMSKMTKHAPGSRCWVDLASPDVDAAAAFYGSLFGWEIPELEDPAEFSGYRRAQKDGADIAGAMPLMQEGQPPAWTSYIAVEDADATAAAVREAGGSVIAEPMDVMDLGRMAVFTDPEGAFFGIWQAGTFAGTELLDEPGAPCWTELNSRDPEAAKRFYGAVFGWSAKDEDMGGGESYTVWHAGEAAVVGLMDMRGRVPDEVPPHWLAYFAVANTDASLETIAEGGGEVAFGPIDSPAGRFAVVRDPWGAVFALVDEPGGDAA
jgi:uncharacterized protein